MARSSAGAIKAGKAFIELAINSKTAIKEIDKFARYVTARMRNLGTKITAVGQQITLLAGAIATPMALFAREAANAEVAALRFRKTLGGNAAVAEQVATQLAKATGFNFRDIRSGIVRLNAFFRSMGLNANDAAKAAQELVGSAADLAAAAPNVADIDDAVNRLASGLRGEEALEEFANTKLVALNEELAKVGKNVKTASELEKLVARFALIQRDFARGGILGTAEETSSSRAGAIRKFASALKDFRIAVGDVALEFGTQFLPKLSQAITGIARLVKTSAPAIKQFLKITSVALAFGVTILALSVALSTLGSILALLIPAAIITALAAYVEGWKSLKDAVNDFHSAANGVKQTLRTLFKAIKVKDAAKQLQLIKELFENVFDEIGVVITLKMAKVFAQIVGIANAAFKKIPFLNRILPVQDDVGQFGGNIEKAIKKAQARFAFGRDLIAARADKFLAQQEEEEKEAEVAADKFRAAAVNIEEAAKDMKAAAISNETAAARTQRFFQFGSTTEDVENKQLQELKEINKKIGRGGLVAVRLGAARVV